MKSYNLTTEQLDGLISKQYTILYTGDKKYTLVDTSITKQSFSILLSFRFLPRSLRINDITLHSSPISRIESSSMVCISLKRFRYHIERISALIYLPSLIKTYTLEATAQDSLGSVKGVEKLNVLRPLFCFCYLHYTQIQFTVKLH